MSIQDHPGSATTNTPFDNKTSRRVLMITYAFPPAGGSGVQRSAKFAKYLPTFGWRPTVWSTHHPPSLPRDESLLDELPESLDHHTRTRWDVATWPHHFARASRTLIQSVFRRDQWGDRASWRIERSVAALVSHLAPDETVCWALGSYRPLRRMIRREKFDAIYSTYSPASNHLVAWMLQRATGLPWVADFRDLWTDEYRYRFATGHRWRRAIDRRMEQRFLCDADAVLAVTDSQTRALAGRVTANPSKFVTITNGLDADDFEPRPRESDPPASHAGVATKRDRFLLTYVGRFTSECITPSLLDGFERFATQFPQKARRFEFRQVGQCTDSLQRRLNQGPVNWVSRGYLPHREAVNEMRAADVLLLALANHPMASTILTGKVFEYLAAGRPILLIGAPDSEAARLIRSCGAGDVCGGDASQVCETMCDLWNRWSADKLPMGCAPDKLEPHTRRHLAGKLAATLDKVRASTSLARQSTRNKGEHP